MLAKSLWRMTHSSLKAIGRSAVSAVNWIDTKGPFVTAIATVVIAVLTSIYVHYSRAQWTVMRDQLPELQKSATAAQDAADTAQKQLEMSERPWVVAEFSPSEPLKFTADGGIDFGVGGKLTNIGHSVALYVHDTPLINLQEISLAALHPKQKQKEACDLIRSTAERFPSFNSGDTLFPQDVAYENMPLHFTKEEVEKARVGNTNTITGLVIVGCVDYVFSFSPKHHQTGYVYEIIKPSPRGQIGSLPIKIGETVLPNQLVVRRSILGGFYAD
jgi:hypothetical protein